MNNFNKADKKPSKILIGAFIATALYMGYKQVAIKYDIRSPEGAVSLALGDMNKYNQFWRSISRTDHCISVGNITSETTYVDLLSSTYHCIVDNKFDEAAESYVLSFALSHFDKSRVQDEQLSMAADYVFMKLAEEFYVPGKASSHEFEQLNKAVKRLEQGDARESFCATVNSLDVPSYKPNYMLTYANNESPKNGDSEQSYAEPENEVKEQYWEEAIKRIEMCR